MIGILIFLLITGFALLFTTGANAQWQLYDDFNSGAINPGLWNVVDPSAVISVENGMAKFVHQAAFPNISSWLMINVDPETIRGIRATVIFDSCDFEYPEQANSSPSPRDVRARLGAFVGEQVDYPDYILYSGINIEPYFNNNDYPRLYGEVPRLDAASGYSWVDTLFWGSFFMEGGMVPEDVMGVPYVFTMEWTTDYFVIFRKGSRNEDVLDYKHASQDNKLLKPELSDFWGRDQCRSSQKSLNSGKGMAKK